ncbi:3-phenylpropionate/trans-cinnamate dioxygenase ferredoxin subunit [Micromonospora nigra]|uniref:3-phenylpropionate/trans-cinnamate dioxygenase ferredoxin subunit n=1 Tax=Micromonospora nigra TaxID=145857 RepID=A0A1C6RX63_9ACTN|nr:non-heme iron oxygenase ferredoxin subunit [Micromonospora nigra]SCL21798.1 3-phenylpropionate/trans-cinnamate dioxygenase ferredoxin subunit [Micromonospora nigra]
MHTTNWIKAGSLSELDDEVPLAVEVGGVPVVLVRDADKVHALRDECTHARVALSQGKVADGEIECAAHGACFNLRTGAPAAAPAVKPVDVYPVRIEGDDVFVDIDRMVS